MGLEFVTYGLTQPMAMGIWVLKSSKKKEKSYCKHTLISPIHKDFPFAHHTLN